MTLTTHTLPLKRTALLLATSLAPLFAAAAVQPDAPAASMVLAALDVPPAAAHQKSLQQNFSNTLRASVDEVALQASLIRSAHAQLNLDLAAGNTRAVKTTEAKLAIYQAAFMKAQQRVRANLLQLQDTQETAAPARIEIRTN